MPATRALRTGFFEKHGYGKRRLHEEGVLKKIANERVSFSSWLLTARTVLRREGRRTDDDDDSVFLLDRMAAHQQKTQMTANKREAWESWDSRDRFSRFSSCVVFSGICTKSECD